MTDLSHEDKVKLLKSRSQGIKSLEDACDSDARSMTEEGKQMKVFSDAAANMLMTDLVHQLSKIRNGDTDSDGDKFVTFSDMKDSMVLSNVIANSSCFGGFSPFWDPTAISELISKSISKVLGPEKIAVENSVLRVGSELYKKIVNQFAIDFAIEFMRRMGVMNEMTPF